MRDELFLVLVIVSISVTLVREVVSAELVLKGQFPKFSRLSVGDECRNGNLIPDCLGRDEFYFWRLFHQRSRGRSSRLLENQVANSPADGLVNCPADSWPFCSSP